MIGSIHLQEEVTETKFHENTGDLNVVIENTCNNNVVAFNHGRPHNDSAAVSVPSEPKYVLHAIASSGNMLTQSALKVLLRKREKLVFIFLLIYCQYTLWSRAYS